MEFVAVFLIFFLFFIAKLIEDFKKKKLKKN